MVVTTEITTLRDFQAWAGAKDNLQTVLENGKMDELDALVEELFYEPVDETTLNDFLWFDLPEFYYHEFLEKSSDED